MANENRNSRNYQAPENVQRSFQQDNPNTQNTHWENTNGQWHASYKDKDNRDVDTYYNGNGKE